MGFNILTFDQLMEHLVRVYFPGPYTETDYIITNGGLGCVFNERLDNEDDPEIRRQLKAYRDTCNSNLEMALSSFPALAPATFENIKALSFGVGFAGTAVPLWHFVVLITRLISAYIGYACLVYGKACYNVGGDFKGT